MMNRLEYLLTCLSEECSEVQKASSKAMRFGMNNLVPGYNNFTNKDDIIKEYYHVTSIIELLEEYGYIKRLDYDKMIKIKKSKKSKLKYFIENHFNKEKKEE